VISHPLLREPTVAAYFFFFFAAFFFAAIAVNPPSLRAE